MPRWLRIAGLAVASLAALWTAAWFFLAQRIEDGARSWAGQESARGTRIGFGALAVDGFPARWRLVAADYEIARPGPETQSLRGARLEATLSPLDLRSVALRFPGTHRLERRAQGDTLVLELEAERPDGVLRLAEDGRMRALEIDLGGVAARLPEGGERMTAGRLRLAVSGTETPAPPLREFLSLALRLEDALTPRAAPQPFAAAIRLAEIELALRGDWRSSGSLAERVAGWRDSGGVVELLRLDLDWAPLRVSGDGTAALDARNRPQAAVTLRVAGLPDLLDALARTRQIGTAQAALFKTLAAGMTRTDPATGRAEITLPITAQDGRLSVAGLPVMPLAPLQLPAR